MAHESEDLSRAHYLDARASLLPYLDGTVAEQNQTVNPRALGLRFDSPLFSVPSEVGPFSTFDARAHLTQNVANLTAIRQWQASRADIQAARYQTETARAHAAAEVARLYVAASRAEAEISVLQSSLAHAENLRDLSSRRAGSGTAPELDVTRAGLNVSRSRQRVLAAQAEQTRTLLDLMRVLNLDWNAKLTLRNKLEDVRAARRDVSEAVSLAKKSRSEFRMEDSRIESARLVESAARLERLPTLVAYADYGVLEGVQTHVAGVALKVPLFDGSRIKADELRASSLAHQEEIRRRDLTSTVELQVRKAVTVLDVTAQAVQVAEEASKLAAEELGRVQRRFEAGLSNNADVIDAQIEVEKADHERIATLFDLANARIDFAVATGTITSFQFD